MEKNKVIDMEMVAKSLKILAVTPAIPDGPWLFFYSVFTFVQNDRYQILVEAEASVKMAQFPDMPVTVYHLEGSDTPQPSILKKRKNVETIEVTSVEQVSDLIAAMTSVRVPENDLLQK
jgi:hypothetical protein